MNFSDNLKSIRKENDLTQEDLAELLDVSRQAVSKWETGDGYPEVEKLLLLSKKLNISLDSLLSTAFEDKGSHICDGFSGKVLISSPNENVVMNCVKVASSQEFKSGKHSPKYALYGISGDSLRGENSTFLGWYADKESIGKELSEIREAMFSGDACYILKYSVKTVMHWGSVRILE